MVSFALSEEQRAIRDLVRTFVANEIVPVAQDLDLQARHPSELFEKAWEIGVLNLTVPTQYGGGGQGIFELCLVAEELGAGCAGITTSYIANELALIPLVLAGTEEQMQAFVAPFCTSPNLAAFCVSEPGGGSDVAGMRTTYRRKGDEYVITGTKQWITNAGECSFYTVFATEDPALRYEGITAFIVPADTPGIELGRKEDKMGQRASVTRPVTFDDVRVPAFNRLGEEREGWLIAMRTFDTTRPPVAANAVGLARAALHAASAYSREREQFGQAIAEFQGIQFMLADMAIGIETARNQTWQAAWLVDQGEYSRYASSIAKCYAADVAMDVTTNAVQVFGGYGYTKDYPVEKYMRDAKVMQIYEGTNQIQRIVISRALLSGKTA